MKDFSANLCSTHYAYYSSEKEKCSLLLLSTRRFHLFHAMYFGLDKIDAF